MKRYALVLGLLLFLPRPAQACLSCGCGGSGSAADLGNAAASLFAKDRQWLLQSGLSIRNFSGSFNERGTWNPAPQDSQITTVSGIISATYFPSLYSSVGLQVPVQATALRGATWGPLGSIAPTDLGLQVGGGLGDIQLQGSYTFLSNLSWATAAWGNLTLPTGQAQGDPQGLTGAGVFSGSAGILTVFKPMETVELFLNVGYSLPFGAPDPTQTPFFLGQALLWQLQGNWQFADRWRVGLGLAGHVGAWNGMGPNQLSSRLKITPSDMYSGVRLGVGIDPPMWGSNNLTDNGLSLVYYQYL
jgi:hypothetical protein